MRPHLRKDIFSPSWVIFNDGRGKRPNDYYESNIRCPFCPGNEKDTPPSVSEKRKEGRWYIRVVRNKYPALINTGRILSEKEGIFRKYFFRGIHEVIIETPNHNSRIDEIAHLNEVFEVFAFRMKEIYNLKDIKYVMLFKNYGRNAGASLKHPHSQIIGLPIEPVRISDEKNRFYEYYSKYKKCLMCAVIENEIRTKKRVFEINDKYIAFAPFASRFNFEIWISPLQHLENFYDEKDFGSLSDIVRKVFNVFHSSIKDLSYNIVFHTAPRRCSCFHWHIEILPKLAMPAGFEWGSGFYINSVSPEKAVLMLKNRKVNFW